jgi:hypothetical protein
MGKNTVFGGLGVKIQMAKFKCQMIVKTNPNVIFGIWILSFDILT